MTRGRARRLIVGVIAAAALVSCDQNAATSSEWDEFPSGLKSSIDAYAADQDCAGLQQTFDTVDAADGSHPDILGYIDDKLSSAGCYG
jgi:hypothetical protein